MKLLISGCYISGFIIFKRFGGKIISKDSRGGFHYNGQDIWFIENYQQIHLESQAW